MSDTTRISVGGERPYDVVVGRGLDAEVVAGVLPGVRRVAVLHPHSLVSQAQRVVAAVESAGAEPVLIPLPEGEAAKTSEVAAGCWAALGASGFTRSDMVIGVGGGATTDLAGFVAATWLRGVRLVSVPTTLLAMVDAAVGGKTGINTAAGKNLVGAFHEPALVVCDLDVLRTLPAVDAVAGLAEVVKVGFTSDPVILDLVEADPTLAVDVEGPVLRELVERAIAVKAAVVSDDLRESRVGGLGREVLNYGHTFGHAVELAEHYRWRHGHAVSVGLVFVSALARLAGRLSDADATRHVSVLASLGLPTSYTGSDFPRLLDAMRVDKKSRGDRLRFVVLDGIAIPGLLEGPDPALLTAAYAEVSRETS